MKWVVACLVVVGSSVGAQLAGAQGAAGAPPTAQFPDAAAKPGAAPVAPPPAAPPPAAPPVPALPPPPPGAPPPPNGTQTYPSEPPPPPGAYPTGPEYLYPVAPPVPDDSNEVFSLTISPLHLILPILQLTAEARVTPHFGISVIGGYGKLTVDTQSSDGFSVSTDKVSVSAYELGGRLIGYPLKKFKSLELGAQIMYLHVATDGASNESGISATGAGVAIGPLVGYKLVTKVGFTFLAQGGFQYLAIQAQDSSGANAQESKFLPLLNLDIGWSF